MEVKSVKQLCSLVRSTVVMFNAFNILDGLVLVFLNGLKSNRLKNVMDQRLTEVTFGVTNNV